MTEIEALSLKKGDKVIFNNQKYIICYVKEVRHRTVNIIIKMKQGNNTVWIAGSENINLLKE